MSTSSYSQAMQQSSNIASEIDAIIAQAMAEYQRAKGVDVFSDDIIDAVNSMPTTPTEPVVEEEPAAAEIIPSNSPSLLVTETTSRFSDAVWFDNIQSKDVTLAGVGGIGSYVAFLLARLHINSLFLYDPDSVEAANMSGQLYGSNDVGLPKVIAMSNFLSQYADFGNYISMREPFTSECSATNIMICGFDNMAARRTFFNVWTNAVVNTPVEDRKKFLFIDGRLAAESFQVFCIRGDDTYNIQKYESEYLFSDAEADETICSYKQTTFMANMIASVMVNLFVNFCANECDTLIDRDLPFFTEYTAETMFFKVVA